MDQSLLTKGQSNKEKYNLQEKGASGMLEVCLYDYTHCEEEECKIILESGKKYFFKMQIMAQKG